MSRVHDSDTEDLSSKNTFNDKSNKISKNSLEERCISTHYDEIKDGKRKILTERKNIVNDDLKLINIEEKKFKIRQYLSSKLTKDKVIVTIDNEEYKLFTKKQKENPDIDTNRRNEQKENQSRTSSGFQKLPIDENSVYTSCYNIEDIIQNQVSNENEYRKLIESDTSRCLQEMNEIIQLVLLGLNDAQIDDETLLELLDTVMKEINEEKDLSKDNDKVVVITSSILREYLTEHLLNKIKFIIAEQIENKKRIVMGYPALIRFDRNDKQMNTIENDLNLFTQSENNQSSSSEEQDTDQSEMKNEEILLNEEETKYLSAKVNLETMEFNNNERKKFSNSLFKFMNLRGFFSGIPFFELPTINDITLDMFLLYKLVIARGGFVEVTELKLWPEIYRRIYGRDYKINFHIYGLSPRIGTSFLRFYYKKYLHSYEQMKELFTISSWLLSANNVYLSNTRTRRFSSKRENPLNFEESKLSSKAIRYLVQYLRSNNYPNPNLFPKSITYILQKIYNTDKNFPPNSTDQIFKTPIHQLESPLSTEFQSEESRIQIEMESKQDFSSETILRTEEPRINEEIQSTTEPTKETTSEVTLEAALELKSETKSEVKLTTEVSSKIVQEKEFSNTESSSSDEEYFTSCYSSNDEESYSIAESNLK